MSPVERLYEDVTAIIGTPYRFMRLAQITQDVVDDVKKRIASRSEQSKGSGASEQLKGYIPDYMWSHLMARTEPEDYRQILNASISLMADAMTTKTPFVFEPYHRAIRGPDCDFYNWGNDFFRPMIKQHSSHLEGVEHVEEIKAALAKGDNVVLLANHQTEADPQVLSILLEPAGHEDLAERTVFVAGHKVTTDPVAVPFSMGRNLLTIFSKKYLDTFAEDEKEAKSARNRETVGQMNRLLSEGGNILWVAPSGGRDRKSPETGNFVPAVFDLQSVGLFQILAKKAEKATGRKTHFYPLAMWTHLLVPPPDDTKAGVGEARSFKRASVGIEFGEEILPSGNRKSFPSEAERSVGKIYQHLDSVMRA